MELEFLERSFKKHSFKHFIVFYPSSSYASELFLEQYTDALVSYLNKGQATLMLSYSPISLLIIDQKQNSYVALSDHFGRTPLYYAFGKKNKFILGTSVKEIFLLLDQDKIEIDCTTIIDMVLFNYPLMNKTLFHSIKRLASDVLLKISKNIIKEIELVKQAEKYHLINKVKNPDYKQICSTLQVYLQSNIKPNLPVLLSMTGGFDSRVNFALLLKLGIKFEAFTFGNPDSNDAVPAVNLCKQYGIKHHLIDLNREFYQYREKYVDRLIESSLNNPFVLDLAHYEFVKELFPASNIVTGYMGGEILTGGNVGSSQVTFTQTAKDLLTSENLLEFKNKFLSNFDTQFIRLDNIPDLDEYLNSFSNYFYKKKTNNQNLTNFLLYEKYHKFFGVIKSIYSPKHHQIDTFMAPEYFNYIHQLPYNYNNTPLFKRNPYTNYLSRRFYAQIIKETTPSLLESKLDRGYKVKDLLSPFGLLNISKNYYLNHTGRGNKLNIKTIDYRKWFEADVFEYLKHSSNLQDYFNKDFVFKVIDEYYVDKQAYPISVFNKLMVIYGLMKAIDLIKKKSANNNAIN